MITVGAQYYPPPNPPCGDWGRDAGHIKLSRLPVSSSRPQRRASTQMVMVTGMGQ
jgi:hypothetical protein